MPCDAGLAAFLAGLDLVDGSKVAAVLLDNIGITSVAAWLSLDGEDLQEALDELKAAKVTLGDRRKLKASLAVPPPPEPVPEAAGAQDRLTDYHHASEGVFSPIGGFELVRRARRIGCNQPSSRTPWSVVTRAAKAAARCP